MDDKQAISAVLKGDRDRYAELIDRYKKMVYAIAWSHLGDNDLSEDAAQESFVKAYCYLRTLRDPDRFDCWLAMITRNVCKTFQRKASRETTFLARWATLESANQTSHDASSSPGNNLSESFAALSPIYREALTVFYAEGKSGKESAQILGISEAAMKVRLHRARTALRTHLEQSLESTLDGLKPSTKFTGSVMGLLPMLQTGFLGAGIIGKLSLAVSAAWCMSVIPFASAMGAMWWFTSLESRAIKDTPDNEFRKTEIRQTAVHSVFVTAATLIGMVVLEHSGITWAVQAILVILALSSLWPGIRQLRVNASPAVYGPLIAVVLMYISLAWSELTVHSHHNHYQLLPMGLAMILTFATTGKVLRRRDNNLFLRCATEGLIENFNVNTPILPRLTDLQMKAFARFLGGEWLVKDYVLRTDTMVLTLPAVRPYSQWLGGGSSISIDRQGECHARMRTADRISLQKILGAPADAKDLEDRVSRVISQALDHFYNGELQEARSMLVAKGEDDIFHKTALSRAELTPGRRIAVAIGTIFLVGLMIFSDRIGHTHAAHIATPATASQPGSPPR